MADKPEERARAEITTPTFRIEPGLKAVPHTAAERGHRSIASMVGF